MAENKNEIHIGDGVADAVKSTINTESAVILTDKYKLWEAECEARL